LSPEERALIEAVWEAKRAGGGSVVWPDGVRLELPGGKVRDNYSSTSADEYFAQLTNAYLGTNHGSDAATGLDRNNGAVYVRRHERELLPLLERLYGTDPGASSTPANPVAATAADDAVYETFRDAMALTGQTGPAPDRAPASTVAGDDRPGTASGADATPTLAQVRSSTVVLGSFVAVRDFTSGRAVTQVSAVPRTYRLLERPTGLDGSEEYAPVGNPLGLTWQSAYAVHARLAPGRPDRIEVFDQEADQATELTFAEFASLLASDPYLARVHAELPVAVLVPDALSRGLDLLRAVRDASGRPVWGHTGRAVLFEETPGGAPGIGVLRDEGRATGQWLHLPADPPGQEPEPPEPLWTVDGELVDAADLVLRPFAHLDGPVAGHRSTTERERGGSRAEWLHAATDAGESAHYWKPPGDGVPTGSASGARSGPSPWFLQAYGRPGAVTLLASDGRTVRFSGERAGRLVGQRRSFAELVAPDRPVVVLSGRAAASPSLRTTTFVQQLADSSGRTVFGAPERAVHAELNPPLGVVDDERTEEPGTWRVAAPRSRREAFDRSVHDGGPPLGGTAVTDDDRMWMFEVLRTHRDLHGPHPADPRSVRPLAAVARLHRAAAPASGAVMLFDKGSLQALARAAFRLDASRPVTDGDIAHLLDQTAAYGPKSVTALFAVGRANPPEAPAGRPVPGVRGAPGAGETSLSPAEARRLAVAATEMDAVRLAGGPGRYVRNPQREEQIAEQVAQWLREVVPQAQAIRPFTPTTDLARLFLGHVARQTGTIQREALPYLVLDRPDVLAAVGNSGRLRGVVLTQPGFAQFLGAHPNLLRELHSAESLPPVAEHVPFLMRYQEVAKALEADPRLRQTVVRELGLIKGLGGKLSLIRAAAESSRVAGAVTSVPQLAEALRAATAPVAAIRALRNNINLTMAIRAYPVDTEQIKAVLGSVDLLRAMNRHPQQLMTVFRMPELLAAARRDPRVLGVLDSDPELSDVLVESPALARRLAGSPQLLRVAYANPGLAEVLSYQPR
ncbi:hypothetical protein ABZ401_33270, partial [Streptomyces sp. NPDC005892]|uniref:hypothetical protein n=1 Tax=Streptomyces sp. NPDC005892 TaxID=3155593 RepID=UPI00340A8921